MIGAVSGAGTGAASHTEKAKLAAAAGQFEALLLTQLLRTARESGSGEGWLGGGADAASASAMEMAEEQFASSLAAQGGLGLAKMVMSSSLNKTSEPAEAPAK